MNRVKKIGAVFTILVLWWSGISSAQVQSAPHSFTSNLAVRSTGADVIALQQILIDKGFLTLITAPTGYFGPGTQTALKKFQTANNITPASGYFGLLTRSFVNNMALFAPVSSAPQTGASQSLKNASSVASQNISSGNQIVTPAASMARFASSSYAQRFIDATTMSTANDSFGYIEVSFQTTIAVTSSWTRMFDWTIPNHFIFGGDPGLPQIKTAFTCVPGAIRTLNVGGTTLVYPGEGRYQCQMTITDINGSVAQREFDFSSNGPSASSSAPIAEISIAPTSTVAEVSGTAPPARTIAAQANVGLLCHLKITDPQLKVNYQASEDSNGELLEKGSGVIINPMGYILTAKHMVDLPWLTRVEYGTSTPPDDVQHFYDSLRFDYCDVGMPPSDTILPTSDQIKTLNPSLQLSWPFPYVATLYFNPPQDGLSNIEFGKADFAILKISGPAPNCATFNICTMPSSFPYTPVLYSAWPSMNTAGQLVNYGYPAEAINKYGGAFTNFLLKGAMGRLAGYEGGNQYFTGKPLDFQWSADDVMPGRSGSPVYWQGYVIGIISSGDAENSTSINATGMPAIYRIMNDDGVGQILRTE